MLTCKQVYLLITQHRKTDLASDVG